MISLQELFRKCNLTAYALGTYVLRPDKTDPTCWSMIIQHCWIQHAGPASSTSSNNVGCHMLVQHHPALLDPTGWSNIIQHCWIQHVGPTSSNIVGRNVLEPFEHVVGWWWSILDKFDWLNFLFQYPSNLVEQTMLDDVRFAWMDL